MKKAVFFDIDGTLWDREMVIPESTREALGLLRQKNIYTFICSGRTPAFIQNPRLLALGFDGILAGCGTCVSIGAEELVYKVIEPKIMADTLTILQKYRMPAVLEGKRYQYVEERDFAGDPFLDMLKQELGENLLGIYENHMNWEVSKFSMAIRHENFQEALKELEEWYDFIIHGKNVVEAVPKGYSKASGIQAVCERLGIEHADTYAFGDSVNDLEMLRYVAHGIAMGNGMQEAKEAADYVTDGLHEDGIYNACRHFGLI